VQSFFAHRLEFDPFSPSFVAGQSSSGLAAPGLSNALFVPRRSWRPPYGVPFVLHPDLRDQSLIAVRLVLNDNGTGQIDFSAFSFHVLSTGVKKMRAAHPF